MARILVADDDVDIRELVEFKLSTLGHEIIAVSDGAAAIDACKAQRPDLAVLDVMMPGVSGLDAIRVIRSDPALADLPVILLTARAGVRRRDRLRLRRRRLHHQAVQSSGAGHEGSGASFPLSMTFTLGSSLHRPLRAGSGRP